MTKKDLEVVSNGGEYLVLYKNSLVCYTKESPILNLHLVSEAFLSQ